MPLYEYLCTNDHWTETTHPYPPPGEVRCYCGAQAERMASTFGTYACRDGVTAPPEIDNVDDIYHGTGLEGSDGVNQFYYESTKTQVDMSTSGGNQRRSMTTAAKRRKQLREAFSDHPNA